MNKWEIFNMYFNGSEIMYFTLNSVMCNGFHLCTGDTLLCYVTLIISRNNITTVKMSNKAIPYTNYIPYTTYSSAQISVGYHVVHGRNCLFLLSK